MNLKKFENQELFEQYKQSSNYKEPNVSLVGNTIMYNGSVSNSSGGNTTKEVLFNVSVPSIDELEDIQLTEELFFEIAGMTTSEFFNETNNGLYDITILLHILDPSTTFAFPHTTFQKTTMGDSTVIYCFNKDIPNQSLVVSMLYNGEEFNSGSIGLTSEE